MYVPKSFLTKMIEAAVAFAVAAWLVKTGICMLQDVWVWLIVIVGVVLVVIGFIKLHQYRKNRRF